MVMTIGPGNPLLADPVAIPYADGSALPTSRVGWGVHITFPDCADTNSLWRLVVATVRERHWVGAFSVTCNTGELSAIYHALDWLSNRRNLFPHEACPKYNVVSATTISNYLHLAPSNLLLKSKSSPGSAPSLIRCKRIRRCLSPERKLTRMWKHSFQ